MKLFHAISEEMAHQPVYGFLICGQKTHGKTYFGYNILPPVLLTENCIYNSDVIRKEYNVFLTDKTNDLEFNVKSVTVTAFADHLKREFCSNHRITLSELEKNKEKYRQDLFSFATKMRMNDNDYYTKKVAEYIESIGNDSVVITDFRQLEEYNYLIKRFPKTKWHTIEIRDPVKPVDLTDPMENKLYNFRKDWIFSRRESTS
jgi:hypothetical protein